MIFFIGSLIFFVVSLPLSLLVIIDIQFGLSSAKLVGKLVGKLVMKLVKTDFLCLFLLKFIRLLIDIFIHFHSLSHQIKFGYQFWVLASQLDGELAGKLAKIDLLCLFLFKFVHFFIDILTDFYSLSHLTKIGYQFLALTVPLDEKLVKNHMWFIY